MNHRKEIHLVISNFHHHNFQESTSYMNNKSTGNIVIDNAQVLVIVRYCLHWFLLYQEVIKTLTVTIASPTSNTLIFVSFKQIEIGTRFTVL